MAGRRSTRSRLHPGRWVPLGLLLGVLVLVGFVARAMLQVREHAGAAQQHLTKALDSVDEGRLGPAGTEVEQARAEVESAETAADSWPLDILGVVPGPGGAIDDARSLVTALGDTTSVAEGGLALYPLVTGPDASLIADGAVDLATLTEVVTLTQGIGENLTGAMAALDDVHGSTPIVGSTFADARDDARDRIEPMARSYAEAGPVLEAMPQLAGVDGTKHYLLAMLNPAELRYSGGATLSLAPLTLDQGVISLGESYTLSDFSSEAPMLRWKQVYGNPFHKARRQRLGNATFSPFWPVSGEELLRAWRAQTGDRMDGMIAIDLPGLADLMRVTGPIDVGGYGTLDADNLVDTLAGSYDDFGSDQAQRHALNKAIVPVFKDKLFTGGQIRGKVESLRRSASGRHFVVYFRDGQAQAAFAGVGMDGDLGTREQDYLGVFTQNRNGSKVDIFQHRTTTSEVTLDDDGTAHVRLRVTVDNQAPPASPDHVDTRTGYFTRWSGATVGVFLPPEATLTSAEVEGEPVAGRIHSRRSFSWYTHDLLLAPGAASTMTMTYDVPGAAIRDGDRLVYSLAMDPQGIVVPQASSVSVTWPEGYEIDTVPEGWTQDGATAHWKTGAFTASQEWEIAGHRP